MNVLFCAFVRVCENQNGIGGKVREARLWPANQSSKSPYCGVLHEKMIVAHTVKFTVFCVVGRSAKEAVIGPSDPSRDPLILFL